MRIREQLEQQAMAPAGSNYNPSRCGYMMPCIVLANGTFHLGPQGWDVVKTGIGTYEITHNLGRTDYVPIAGVYAQGDYKTNVAIASADANKIVVRTTDSTQVQDGAFALFVMGL